MPFHSLDGHMLPASHRDAALATLTGSQQEQMWTVALPALQQNPYHPLLRASDHSASRSVCTASAHSRHGPRRVISALWVILTHLPR